MEACKEADGGGAGLFTVSQSATTQHATLWQGGGATNAVETLPEVAAGQGPSVK